MMMLYGWTHIQSWVIKRICFHVSSCYTPYVALAHTPPQDSAENFAGVRAVEFISQITNREPNDPYSIAMDIMKTPHNILRERHLANYLSDCKQADKVIQSLRSFTPKQLDVLGNELAKVMIP